MTDDRPTDGTSVTELGSLDVHIWCRHTESIDGSMLDALVAALSTEERARASRFHFDVDRRDYIVAHDLLRRVLSRYGGRKPSDWTFDVEPGGRPRLRTAAESPDTFTFSLSHTRGFVACAVARGLDVGVDVERDDRRLDPEDLGRTVLSALERDALGALGEASRSTRAVELWTLKEAYAKATGEGLSADLRAASFVMAGESALDVDVRDAGDRARWQFALFAPWPSQGARVAVAARTCAPALVRMLAFIDDEGRPSADRASRRSPIPPLRTSR